MGLCLRMYPAKHFGGDRSMVYGGLTRFRTCPTMRSLLHPARMAELADAPDLGSGGVTRAGSSPVPRTVWVSRVCAPRCANGAAGAAVRSSLHVHSTDPHAVGSVCLRRCPAQTSRPSWFPWKSTWTCQRCKRARLRHAPVTWLVCGVSRAMRSDIEVRRRHGPVDEGWQSAQAPPRHRSARRA